MLKIKNHIVAFFCLALLFSCKASDSEIEDVKEIEEEEIIEEVEIEDERIYDGAVFTITNGMTFSEINAVLKATVQGDIVEVEAGTYTITGELAIKSGIAIRKKSTEIPVFTAFNTSTTKMLQQYWTANNSDLDIYGIQFDNIRINIQNASSTSFRDCVFDYGRREEGTTKTYTQDAYIQIYNCEDIRVENSVFKRRIGNSGRGIYIVNSTNTKILNNAFGNGADEGYFVTAINENSNGTLISANSIKRNTSWINLEETDHGIYAHSFNDITIQNNTISGWPTNSSGGALKIRNGDKALVQNNILNTSGILLYVYENTLNYPYLKNIKILNNTISITNAVDDIYHGIGYWRNTTTAGFFEESIHISDNSLANGTIKIVNPVDTTLFNLNGGGVFTNDTGSISIVSGIHNSGNY